MALPRRLLAGLGVTAALVTAVHLVLVIANTVTPRISSNVQQASIAAAVLEGLTLASLGVLILEVLRKTIERRSQKSTYMSLGASLALSVLAMVASVVALLITGFETDNADILGGSEAAFLIASSVVLGLSFAAQLGLLVAYFLVCRSLWRDRASVHTEEGGWAPSQPSVKAVPYSQTSQTNASKPKERASTDVETPPGSSSGRSAAETFSSIRTSLSHVIHPVSSKTRLLSTSSRNSRRTSRSINRPNSIDSFAPREVSAVATDDGFDSWDTSSAVDAHNRLTVMDTLIPSQHRFLETIPASPTTSRSPSPGCPLDLEPPKKTGRNRSRSYSPVPRPPPALTAHASSGELHIHPLFRSDSPTPPPAATPGTVVIAAPEGGRVISESTLSRMRSGSLPAPSSPLSRQGSFETSSRKSPSPSGGRLTPLTPDSPEERKMTPPIPDWILSAGSRSSLTEYHCRKLRNVENEA